jgi:hypothetical protein
MKTYETLLTETIGDHLLKVTLNRPEVGNAKNTLLSGVFRTNCIEVPAA